MMELLRPSLEEAFVIQTQDVALDFIGKRGSTVGASRERRLAYARQILQKEFLPHVSTEEHSETKKAYFFGYIIHRLLSTVLGRRDFDDRDHFGNKRMDLAGPLMGHLFRQLFARLIKDTRLSLSKKMYALSHVQARIRTSLRALTLPPSVWSVACAAAM